MSDPRSITAEAFEILVGRELRRAGIAPVELRRRNMARAGDAAGYTFDLQGRLEAYGRRWSVLIECRNRNEDLRPADVHELRARADAARAVSALLFTTTEIDPDAATAARAAAIPLLRLVDAHSALIATGAIQEGPLPAWLPEFTIEILTAEGRQLAQADDPELILRELRAET